MLEKQREGFIAQCDFCPDTVETEEHDFQSAIDEIKRQGWKVFKRGGEWFHKCVDCQHGDVSGDFEDLT